VLELVQVFYGTFGIQPTFKLATRPGQVPRTASSGTMPSSAWRGLRANGLPFALKPGDGAFYAPKIDIHIEDVLGRDWQMATVQADLTMLPERFDLEYVDADNRPKRPIVIHRAILGSYERFIGILIEHFAGAFPTWLAPVQARVLPVSAKHAEYAGAVHRRLVEAGVRVELDDRSRSWLQGARGAAPEGAVRAGRGEREAREGTASVRKRGGEDVGAMPLDRFLAEVTAEIRTRAVSSRIGPERG
jgi:threonyl-tRNA synthetase